MKAALHHLRYKLSQFAKIGKAFLSMGTCQHTSQANGFLTTAANEPPCSQVMFMHGLQHHLYTEVASLDLFNYLACHVFSFTADVVRGQLQLTAVFIEMSVNLQSVQRNCL